MNKQRKIVFLSIAILAVVVIISAGFVETCTIPIEGTRCLEDYGYDVICDNGTASQCTNFWTSVIDPIVNSKFDMKQIIIEHPTFKEVKGIPSTLDVKKIATDDEMPIIYHHMGCFNTETGEKYTVSYSLQKDWRVIYNDDGTLEKKTFEEMEREIEASKYNYYDLHITNDSDWCK